MSAKMMNVVIPAYNEQKTIARTLSGLYEQRNTNFGAIVVDNASTDETLSVVHDFMDSHQDFPCEIVEENNKGTGYACNAGFERAMQNGAEIIARTDADTVPNQHWTDRIQKHFDAKDTAKLLGGTSLALKDEYHKFGDNVLCPIGSLNARIIFALQWRSISGFEVAIGHNFATTADGFEEAGGFSETTISEADEDIEYSKAIAAIYGPEAMTYDPLLIVRTSLRRIRKIGYWGSLAYWAGDTVDTAARVTASGGDVDIR